MNKTELQKQLQQHYSRDTWNEVLDTVFPSVHFLREPEPILMNTPHVTSVHQTGMIRLKDGKNIALFEVVLDEHVKLWRNRVGVRGLMTRFIDEVTHHGVLVVYDQGNANYRLTFVARESGFNEQGELATFETASKRFTYVLGEGETCRTAAERLAILAAKKDAAGLDDVIEAFSVERLSKEFFTRYKTHYQAFVEYLNDSNFNQSAFRGDEKAIRDFVKKLLGRIVFLHFLQKKGWMGATDATYSDGDKHFMQHFWEVSGKGESFYVQHLIRLFFDALNTNQRDDDAFLMPDGSTVRIPYLNGGLFDKDPHEPEWLTFPPGLFDNLFAFFGEYNFTIDEHDPEEREVGIDPEMLGHIFENLLEDNKDKGAFYTPKEIVQYMTQESLIEYLYTGLTRKPTPVPSQAGNSETPLLGGDGGGLRKPLEYFIRYKLKGDELPQEELKGDLAQFFKTQLAFIQAYGSTLNRLLDEVKICDPAIGSGAFPMGLLHEMYHCKLLLNNTYTLSERAAVKRHIIEHSIYGVDIEQGAVDIARLRFWLSLIVDEDRPTPLPNLDYKIVAGDSLISQFEDEVIEIDWNDEKQETMQFGLLGSKEDEQTRNLLQRITEKQRIFFHADATEKASLSAEIRTLKIDLLIKQLEAMIKNKGTQDEPKGKGKAAKKQMELYLQTIGWKQTIHKLKSLKKQPKKPFTHFDWKLDFPEILNPALAGENPGFDIVIGNPPYVRQEQIKEQKPHLKSRFGDFYTSTADLYTYFYKRGLELNRKTGILCYISPNKLFRAGYGAKLRQELSSKYALRQIIDFGELPVFAAGTDPAIILVAHATSHHPVMTAIIKEKEEIQQLTATINAKRFWIPQEALSHDGWTLERPEVLKLLKKLKESGVPLGEYVQGKFYRGILTGFNEAFVIDSTTRERLIAEDANSAEMMKPWLRGKDIRRWYADWQNFYIINIQSGANKGWPWSKAETELQAEQIFMQTYPAIFKHLIKWKIPLKKREDQGQFYWELRSCNYYETFEIPKLVYNETSLNLHAFYDTSFLYINKTGFIISTEHPEFLLGVLCSRLMDYYYRHEFPAWGDPWNGGRVQFRGDRMKAVPIVDSDEEIHQHIVRIVKQIITTKQNSHEADISEFEAKIDLMVYKLYDLTYEEVLVVDPEFWLDNAAYQHVALPE